MNIWIWALMLGLLAVGASAFFYWRSQNKKFASRALDIISYALTVVGFVSLFFALQNYENQISLEREKTELTNVGRKFFEFISTKITTFCSRPGGAIILIDGCQLLQDYLPTLRSIDFSVPVIIPNINPRDSQKVPQMREVPNEIGKHNDAVTDFRKRSSEAQSDESQYKLILVMIVMFSLSFAFGISRRGYDAWVDLRGK